jgi:hypothetical protein
MVGLPEMSFTELKQAASPAPPAPPEPDGAPAPGGTEARLRRMLGNGHLPAPELDPRTMRALRELAGRN